MTWTTCSGCGKSWDDAHIAPGTHVCPAVAAEEIDWHSRAIIAEAEVARLTARVAELSSLDRNRPEFARHWWCLRGTCETLNEDGVDSCRRCGVAKAVRT